MKIVTKAAAAGMRYATYEPGIGVEVLGRHEPSNVPRGAMIVRVVKRRPRIGGRRVYAMVETVDVGPLDTELADD